MSTAAPTIPAGLAKWLAARNPTPAQRDVVTTYLRLRDEGDGVVNPTQSEIADALGVARSCVNEHVGHLIAKGVFARQAYKRGGLRLLWDEDRESVGDARIRAEVQLALRELRTVAVAIRGTHQEASEILSRRIERLREAAGVTA